MSAFTVGCVQGATPSISLHALTNTRLMKITHVEPIILRLPKVTEDVDGTQDDLLIKVETDEGIHA